MGQIGQNAGMLWLRKSLFHPTCTSPRENHSPRLPNQSSGVSACWTSASEFHLQGKRQEKVEKSRGHFLARSRRHATQADDIQV